jgi:outer membrane protein assembly factor BamA
VLPTCGICNYTRDLPDDYNLWPRVVQGSIDIYPVTPFGKPTQPPIGFICALCLRAANSMRIYIKSIVQGVNVTQHAIKRFLERRAGEKMTEETARVTILKLYAQSKPIRFKSQHMIHRFLKNEFTEVRYTYAQGLIFVVTREEPPVVVTVEATGHRKMNEDFWYEEGR